MKRLSLLLIPALIAAAPALADGHLSENAAFGEKAFKLCQSCHVVRDPEGTTLAGRKAKTGPNLYGLVGRTAGTEDGFRYSKSMVAAGEEGLIWTEENFIAFLLDPKAFMKSTLDDSKARTKMSFKIRPDRKNDLSEEEVAANLYTLLKELGPSE